MEYSKSVEKALKWRQNNKEKSNAINKKYYETHKEKINEKRRQKYKEDQLKKKIEQIEYISNNKQELINKLNNSVLYDI